MANVIILGAQWGDEGKGKIVDLFCERFDIVVRYQGGHNAGHTVLIGDKKYVLKLVPSGILRGKRAVIGNGLVIDPAALLAEIDMLQSAGVAVQGNLFISNRAHVLFPWHRMMERATERRPGTMIGTTSRGIGPCYEDKTGRRGLRVAELLDPGLFSERFDAVAEEKTVIAKALGIYDEHDVKGVKEEYRAFAARIAPMVCDTTSLLAGAMREGRRIMFEGAQGTMLDIDHGTYPFVTSSSASAGGACTGSGVPPTCISGVIGVSKAYITRVGSGPFPTEALDEHGDNIRNRGGEFGSVTGRPRRCGWFDVPLLRYTAAINGFDSLVVTKLDVLDHLESIPVCVGYRTAEGAISEMPPTARGLERVLPVYECLPGWKTATPGVTSFGELPARARDYLAFLESRTGIEVGCVSVGPERRQTMVRSGSRLEKLLT
ncbi:MAG: adenylosuccinate synthase [Bryobacteraceae bacterium]